MEDENAMEQPLIIFIDFDGTISRQDVSQAMLERFCQGDWRRWERLWEQGQLSTARCAAEVLAMMKATPGELEDFFREQEIDPSFPDFMAWARRRGLEIHVLSDGFENYITAIMDKYRLDFNYYANRLEYNGAWRMVSPHGSETCQQCGVCKKELIAALKSPEQPCVYIGDGFSDACAAPSCGLIFAKDQLAAILKEQGCNFFDFSSFASIQQTLNSLFPEPD